MQAIDVTVGLLLSLFLVFLLRRLRDAKTGEMDWKGRAGGNYRASPILADGKLYFFSLEGMTTVIEPGREFKVHATNELAANAPLDDPGSGPGSMASPAVVGNAMFVRTRYHLYRIEGESGLKLHHWSGKKRSESIFTPAFQSCS